MTSTETLNTTELPVAFRDTALTVTMLRWQGRSASFEILRQRCREQVQRLRMELQDGKHPDEVVQDAVYAQCALLDEAALSHLKDQARDAWEREPMQVAEFGTHDAGNALIARMQRRLQEATPVRPLLAIFLAVLALGFHGRFAIEGRDARAVMMKALNDRLGSPEPDAGGIIIRSGHRRGWLAHISLPVCVALAVAVAIVTWIFLDRWLDAAAAQLLG